MNTGLTIGENVDETLEDLVILSEALRLIVRACLHLNSHYSFGYYTSFAATL